MVHKGLWDRLVLLVSLALLDCPVSLALSDLSDRLVHLVSLALLGIRVRLEIQGQLVQLVQSDQQDRLVHWGLLGHLASPVKWEILDLVVPLVIGVLLDLKGRSENQALLELWALRVQKAKTEALDREVKMVHQDRLDPKAPKVKLAQLLQAHRESRVFQDRPVHLDLLAPPDLRVTKVMPALKARKVRKDKEEIRAKEDLMARMERRAPKETKARKVPMVPKEEMVEMVKTVAKASKGL